MLDHFPDPLISIEQMARARADRIAAAAAVNPVIRFPQNVAMTSLGETSLVMLTFTPDGSGQVGPASRQLVDTFFREERIPFDQGYKVPAQRVTAEQITIMGQQITAASPAIAAGMDQQPLGTLPPDGAGAGAAAVASGAARNGLVVSMMSCAVIVGGMIWTW